MGDQESGKSKPEIIIHPNREALAVGVASHVALLAARAIVKRKRFYVALSGGSLMTILCPPLVSEPLRNEIDWSGWHIFWADERYVPPPVPKVIMDSPINNYSDMSIFLSIRSIPWTVRSGPRKRPKLTSPL